MGPLYQTVLYSILVSNLYVGVLYIKQPLGERNDPNVIKSRLIRVITITSLLIISAPYVLTELLKTAPDYESSHHLLGLTSLLDISTWYSMLKTLVLFMILFIGPLFEHLIELDNGLDIHNGPLGIIRDMIVAPITEELVYTSLALSPFLALHSEGHRRSLKDFANDEYVNALLWKTPVLFGFAHLHHLYNLTTRSVNPLPMMHAIIMVTFQLCYTTLFGYLTNKIFISTGNVWSCIVAHAFCNWLGFPTLDLGKEYSLFIRVIYWSLLILGVWGFSEYFTALTV